MSNLSRNLVVCEPRPKPLTPIFEAFPEILTNIPCWVVWKYFWNGKKWTKPLYQPNGQNASSTNSSTWVGFDEAKAAYKQGGFDGVGVVLDGKPIQVEGRSMYLIGLDFDNCIIDRKLLDYVKGAIQRIGSYWEVSPSGNGIRIFLLHDKLVDNRKINVDNRSREIYCKERYLTVTGRGKGEVIYVI